MTPNFAPCVSCGKSNVLKPGDYCPTCAILTDLSPDQEYIILSPAMLDIAADKSGITREFLVAKMNRAFENYQSYVIYRHGETWKDIIISDKFYIPAVMKSLFKKLEGKA